MRLSQNGQYARGLNVSYETQLREQKSDDALSAIISRDGDDIPDGGLVAWLQVVGAFFFFFNTWGVINAFGTFQTYYQNRFPEQSASTISWIGSIDAFLLMSGGIFTGPLFDLGYFRHLQAVGSFLVVFGIMMTSIVKEFWQVMLAQGLCFGFGCGCLYVPSVSITSTYFSKRRSLALGFVTSGSGFGSVIYSIVFYRLEPRIGYGPAIRVIGYIALGTCIIANCIMRPRIKPTGRRSFFAWRAFKELPFTWFTVAMFFGYMGLYIPIDYISSYTGNKLYASQDMTFYIIPIMNAGSIFGRIIPNYIADWVGPINVLIPCTFACGVLALAWIGINNIPGIIVFGVIYGFLSGTYVSLPPAAVASLTKDLHHVGSRMGTCFLFAAFGILIGSPAAGVLVSLGPPIYWKAQVFCGVLIFVATTFTILARISGVGTRLAARA